MNEEQHRIWCDECGVEHKLVGRLPPQVVAAIRDFNDEHDGHERSIMRTADLDRERILEALQDRRALALENEADDYTTGYADAMDNAIGIIKADNA